MAAGAGVRGLNHVTLAVSDLGRSVAFYADLLGCTLKARWDDGAYLEAGELWLCLSVGAASRERPHPDYTHLAFDVAPEDFGDLASRVAAAAPLWRDDRSEGASLYFTDPDGHRLELHVGSLASRLAHYRAHPLPERWIAPPAEDDQTRPVPASIARSGRARSRLRRGSVASTPATTSSLQPLAPS